MNLLRSPIHPGQADTLVHFCGRGRPSASPEVATLAAPDRLEWILGEHRIRAFPPFVSPEFGTAQPVVCFSESDSGGVEAILRFAGWEAWGIVVRRQWAWNSGGGPVWYARDDIYRGAMSSLTATARSWVVRTEPQNSDWLHEREWRIPCAAERPFVRLGEDALVAILVADPSWEPPLEMTWDMNPMTGEPVMVARTRKEHLVPRWYWNGSTISELGPVPVRIEYWDP